MAKDKDKKKENDKNKKKENEKKTPIKEKDKSKTTDKESGKPEENEGKKSTTNGDSSAEKSSKNEAPKTTGNENQDIEKKAKIILTYFDGNGRAELARLIMAAGNIEYHDNRITEQQWQDLKPNATFNQLPILEYDGQMLVQSMTIARFLAKKAGLYGKDDLEQAKSDQVADYVSDYSNKWVAVFRAQSVEEQQELIDYNFRVLLPKFLLNCERILETQGSKYFAGDNLSYGDIYFFQVIYSFTDPDDPFFKTLPGIEERLHVIKKYYPILEKHKDRVLENPGIKKWIENRPRGLF